MIRKNNYEKNDLTPRSARTRYDINRKRFGCLQPHRNGENRRHLQTCHEHQNKIPTRNGGQYSDIRQRGIYRPHGKRLRLLRLQGQRYSTKLFNDFPMTLIG